MKGWDQSRVLAGEKQIHIDDLCVCGLKTAADVDGVLDGNLPLDTRLKSCGNRCCQRGAGISSGSGQSCSCNSVICGTRSRWLDRGSSRRRDWCWRVRMATGRTGEAKKERQYNCFEGVRRHPDAVRR